MNVCVWEAATDLQMTDEKEKRERERKKKLTIEHIRDREQIIISSSYFQKKIFFTSGYVFKAEKKEETEAHAVSSM